MEVTLLIMENHGIVFVNFFGKPDIGSDRDIFPAYLLCSVILAHESGRLDGSL